MTADEATDDDPGNIGGRRNSSGTAKSSRERLAPVTAWVA